MSKNRNYNVKDDGNKYTFRALNNIYKNSKSLSNDLHIVKE
jgi:hypothetical protein